MRASNWVGALVGLTLASLATWLLAGGAVSLLAMLATGYFGLLLLPVSAVFGSLIPVAGQQAQLQRWLGGQPVAVLPSLLLGLLTTAVVFALVRGTALWMERDDAGYGR